MANNQKVNESYFMKYFLKNNQWQGEPKARDLFGFINLIT